jgi:hypothetical protein
MSRIRNTVVFIIILILPYNAGGETVEPRLTASQGRGRTSPLSGYGTGLAKININELQLPTDRRRKSSTKEL